MGDLLVDQPMPGEQLEEDGSSELLGRAQEAYAVGVYEIQQGTHQRSVQVFPVYTVYDNTHRDPHYVNNGVIRRCSNGDSYHSSASTMS